jgi:hypothetical protein
MKRRCSRCACRGVTSSPPSAAVCIQACTTTGQATACTYQTPGCCVAAGLAAGFGPSTSVQPSPTGAMHRQPHEPPGLTVQLTGGAAHLGGSSWAAVQPPAQHTAQHSTAQHKQQHSTNSTAQRKQQHRTPPRFQILKRADPGVPLEEQDDKNHASCADSACCPNIMTQHAHQLIPNTS